MWPSSERVSAATVAKRTRKRRKQIAQQTWHRWTPIDRPLVGLNPQANAPATERYVTLTEITYCNAMFRLEIPEGMKLDLGSIPRPLWWIPGLDPTDANYRGCLAHDAMYRQQLVAREIADALLLSILREDGVAFPIRSAIYLAVRLFGERAWTANGRRLIHEKAKDVFDADDSA